MTKAFQFQEFELIQEQAAHKLGTDAMVLGAWAELPGAMNILDIGTGTGVLALMMAQRHVDAIVDAVEIHEASALEARKNFEQSPWGFRLTVYPESVQQFSEDETLHYDLIICNPPFFEPINKEKGNNKQEGSAERENARQTKALSFESLITVVSKLLVTYGRFYTVLPIEESTELVALAKEKGLIMTKSLWLKHHQAEEPFRKLMCFEKVERDYQEETLSIYEADGAWTNQYEELTRPFHKKPN